MVNVSAKKGTGRERAAMHLPLPLPSPFPRDGIHPLGLLHARHEDLNVAVAHVLLVLLQRPLRAGRGCELDKGLALGSTLTVGHHEDPVRLDLQAGEKVGDVQLAGAEG